MKGRRRLNEHSASRKCPLPLLLNVIVVAVLLSPVTGTQVNWSGNQNVNPKHKAAHEAPRSQRYWDEHGIERPDYAKTDAEIAAERRQRGDSSVWQTWIGTSMLLFYIIFGFAAVSAIGYGSYTGDWSVIGNNPINSFIDECINRIAEAGGMKGHKLGSSGETKQPANVGASEEERRRIARLARFENPNPGRDLLDSMKED